MRVVSSIVKASKKAWDPYWDWLVRTGKYHIRVETFAHILLFIFFMENSWSQVEILHKWHLRVDSSILVTVAIAWCPFGVP